MAKILKPLLLPYYLYKVERINRNRNWADAVPFAFKEFRRVIRPSQVPSEIESLLRSLHAERPKHILEIGTKKGGTLFLFSRVAAEDAQILSVDLPSGPFGGGYPAWKIPLYKSFALPKQKVHLIRGNSQEPATLQKVREILNGKELDFLFIDGDHTYEGAKRDFEIYSPLVKKNGLVALHDIVDHPTRADCEVNRLWTELRPKYDYEEFVEDPNQGWAGIGVLKMHHG
jgi:cephalosporin hydroxylase